MLSEICFADRVGAWQTLADQIPKDSFSIMSRSSRIKCVEASLLRNKPTLFWCQRMDMVRALGGLDEGFTGMVMMHTTTHQYSLHMERYHLSQLFPSSGPDIKLGSLNTSLYHLALILSAEGHVSR